MPVLLLAKGDDASLSLLRKAIDARYGPRPPAFDTLAVDFSGRVHTRLGPLKTWVPLAVTAKFSFPNQMRWDFTAKPAGVPIRSGVESYDGDQLRTMAGNKPQIIHTPDNVSSFQKRLWAIAALLLTPLADHFVALSQVSDNAFTARNTQMEGTAVEVRLTPEGALHEVVVNCLNTDAGKKQNFILRPSSQLVMFDDILLPNKISAFWDDDPWFEMEPTRAENDPEIEHDVFTLGAQIATN